MTLVSLLIAGEAVPQLTHHRVQMAFLDNFGLDGNRFAGVWDRIGAIPPRRTRHEPFDDGTCCESPRRSSLSPSFESFLSFLAVQEGVADGSNDSHPRRIRPHLAPLSQWLARALRLRLDPNMGRGALLPPSIRSRPSTTRRARQFDARREPIPNLRGHQHPVRLARAHAAPPRRAHGTMAGEPGAV